MPNSFLPSLEKIKRKQSEPILEEEALLTEGSLGYSFENPHKSFINYYQKIIFIVLGIFAILLFTNVIIDKYLNLLKNQQDSIIFKLDNLSADEERLKETDSKISYYKMALEERNSLGDITEFVFNNLPKNIELITFTIDPESFKIMLKGNSPVQIATIIQKYVSDSKVSTIAIESAHFDSANSIYTVQLKGNLNNE